VQISRTCAAGTGADKNGEVTQSDVIARLPSTEISVTPGERALRRRVGVMLGLIG
jgi:hypothetical protein